MGTNSHPPEKPVISPEWQRKNSRRIALIKKLNREGLSEGEQAEFEHLQKTFFEYLKGQTAEPVLDGNELNRLKAELKCAKEEQKRTGS